MALVQLPSAVKKTQGEAFTKIEFVSTRTNGLHVCIYTVCTMYNIRVCVHRHVLVFVAFNLFTLISCVELHVHVYM